MPDGRMAALRRRRREESPGSTEVRCRVTPGGGDPRESATESTPPVRPGTPGGRQGGNGAVRAHRAAGNGGGRENPTGSQTKQERQASRPRGRRADLPAA